MRKLFLLLPLIAAFPLFAAASSWQDGDRPYRYEVNLSWGGFPMLDALNFSGYDFLSVPDGVPCTPRSLADIYADYTGPSYSTGVISADFNIQFKKWFALGLQANFDGIWSSLHSSDTGERLGNCSGVAFSFLPYARFTYLNRPVVKLYSAVGLGIVALMDRDFLCLEHLDELLGTIADVRSEDYLLQMAVAWFFATAYTYHPDESLPFFARLDDVIRRRAVRKCRESRRITPHRLEALESFLERT